MKKSKNFYQQGDVLFKRVKKLPDGLESKESNIIVEGEHTGHHHAVNTLLPTKPVENDPYDLLRNLETGQMFLKADHGIAIQHHEHNTIHLPAGIWEVEQVKEYDYDEQEARRVID